MEEGKEKNNAQLKRKRKQASKSLKTTAASETKYDWDGPDPVHPGAIFYYDEVKHKYPYVQFDVYWEGRSMVQKVSGLALERAKLVKRCREKLELELGQSLDMLQSAKSDVIGGSSSTA